ncbi:MAG: hypothetical protein J6S00_02345 [Clostridia bacterium]|nr:hypothetical protein [Clostridia bacterium]
MQKNIKVALSCWVRYMICAVLAFFIYLSISVLTVGTFTNVIGYEARNADTGETLYVYYYEDGEDLKIKEYEEQGIEVATLAVRDKLSGNPKFFTVLIAQLISLIIVFSFIYKHLWALGDSDANLVNFDRIKPNKFRGLIIGAFAIIPNVLSWFILIFAKFGIITDEVIHIFRFINYQMFSLVNLALGETTISVNDVTFGQIFLTLTIFLVLPLVAEVAYILGFKRIRLSEKIIYRKNDRG